MKNFQDKLDLPIIAGLLPIKTKKMAYFMNNNVDGITIPKQDMDKFETMSDQEIFAYQIKKARNIFLYAKKIGLAGVHIMSMGRGDKVAEIVGYDFN